MRRASLLLLAAGLLLSGCGDEQPDTGATGATGRVVVTPQALAVVAAEHAGEPDSATGAIDDDLGTGTELRYHSDGEYDGDLLAVAVVTGDLEDEIPPCDLAAPDHCADLGGDSYVAWEEEAPEEDPGVLSVVHRAGGAQVVVTAIGESISGDPRDLDLAFSVDVLAAIATDPRVGVTTTEETVDAGERLAWWREG